ncbi:MAG TPA: L,D-transpeptidase family protein [Trebonia sp.]|nr:L,D-transpeptidase family protein [Trebonia sp.]
MGTASAAVAVVIAGSTFAAVSQGPGHEAMASTANSHAVAGQPSGQASASSGTTDGSSSGTSGTAQGKGGGSGSQAQPSAPLQVVSVTPSDGTSGANGAGPITVTFNEPLAPSSPQPTLSPQVEGSWSISGKTATFQPQVGFTPSTSVTLTIPGGKDGVQAAGLDATGTTTTAATDVGLLAKTDTVHFTTGSYSVLRLQELLTQLGYLPLTWAPTDPSAGNVSATDANAQLSAAYDPPGGTFTFKSGYPSQLTSQWKSGKANELDTGAIMAFQNDNGIGMDGVAGPDMWAHLLTAVAQDKQNPNGYTYSLADQHEPQRLRVWHNGQQILSTLVNTGAPGAGTQDGTFPVFERFKVTQMKGTNPDGSKYDDTVYWVSYFNGGDALHYFPRPGYGYYQSNGCVEMQLQPAKDIWKYTTYGSLVTVQGPEA